MKDNIKPEPYPCLYFIVDAGLKSMNAGKAEAHANHVGSQFVLDMIEERESVKPYVQTMFDKWKSSGRGFGTAIALEGDAEVMSSVMEYLSSLCHNKEKDNEICAFSFGEVIDPTYPYVDYVTGEARTREQTTAIWWFAMSDDTRYTPLKKMKLKP